MFKLSQLLSPSIARTVLKAAHPKHTVYDKVHAYLTHGLDNKACWDASFYIDKRDGIVIITPQLKNPSSELEDHLKMVRTKGNRAFLKFLKSIMGTEIKGFELKASEPKKPAW